MSLFEADRDVPALIVKIGYYPVQAGGLGAVRTLGRLGVPVHVIAEDPFTSLALSRYRARRFRWRTTGLEPADVLVAGLAEIGARIGRRSVAIPTDDEAATLLAEHADELSAHFLIPRVDPGLPRRLASKHELFLLCREHDIPAAEAALVSTRAELAAHAEHAVFPLVLKNGAPWVRLRAQMVSSTTVVHSKEQLVAFADTRHEDFRLFIQEYIPREQAQDWIVHVYCDANSDCLALFTARKLRSWPAHAGNTACAYTTFNPVLADLTLRFCKAVGFRGIADLDWRLDLRDGRYKLVDFNPRVGNNFSLFRTRGGIDVVRAMHLDLTGRSVPADEQVDGRRLVVEHYDLAARIAYRGAERAMPAAAERAATTVRAFAAVDDPLPFLALWPRQSRQVLSRMIGRPRSPMQSGAAGSAKRLGRCGRSGARRRVRAFWAAARRRVRWGYAAMLGKAGWLAVGARRPGRLAPGPVVLPRRS